MNEIKIKLTKGVYLVINLKEILQKKKKEFSEYFEATFISPKELEVFERKYVNYLEKGSLIVFYSEPEGKYCFIWRKALNKYWKNIKKLLEEKEYSLEELVELLGGNKETILAILRYKQKEGDVFEPESGKFKLIKG
jgi:DNA-binding Xre family transcriptional regulator